jgi:hypothetical protein
VSRPAEWADLLRLGVSVAGAVVAVPARVGQWFLHVPIERVRRLLGA